MLRFRTKLLLAVMFASGLGIGVLSRWSDGLYSAVCLFALPILVALAGAAIIADFSQENREEKAEAAPNETHGEGTHLPHAA